MKTPASPRAAAGPPDETVRTQLAERARQELDALRSAFKVRLAALEAALANPGADGSIEPLVIDLARVATEEAESATARAVLHVQLDLQAQVSAARADAEKATASLEAERAASRALRTELVNARAAVEQERRDAAALRQEVANAGALLEQQKHALAAIGAELVSVRTALDEEQRASAASREAVDREKGSRAAVEKEKAALREALEAARAATTTAQAAADARGRDLDDLRSALVAAGERADVLERERGADAAAAARGHEDLTRELTEARSERDALAAELERLRAEAAAASEAAEKRFSDLQDAAAERIRALELDLLQREIAAIESRDVELAAMLEMDEPGADGRPAPTPDTLAGLTTAVEDSLAAASGVAPPAAFPGPARRASRQAFVPGVAVQLDGAEAVLVDLSLTGAQVISLNALKPNRAVRLLLPGDSASVVCKGRIVWSRLEPPSKGEPFRYRAGIFFLGTDDRAVASFIARHGAAGPQLFSP